MTRRTLFMTICAAGMIFSQSSDAITHELLKLEQALEQAAKNKDLPFLEAHIADDFVWTSRRGNQMTKQEYLKRIQEGTGLLSQAPGASSNPENVRVRTLGDTAVITAILNYKSNTQQMRVNTTDVYVRNKGKWQLFAAHSSVAPNP